MIIVDFSGYMVSTDNEEELHAFAKKLGMKRTQFQAEHPCLKHPHYDLVTSVMMNKAIGMGAEEVSPRGLVRRASWGNGEDGVQFGREDK